MVMTMVFSACSQASPTSSPSQAQAPAANTTVPATTAKPPGSTTASVQGAKILKFAYSMQKTGPTGQAFEWWGQQVAIRTNGRYTVDSYPGQTLFKSAEAFNSIKAGVADVSSSALGADSKALPITSVLLLPSANFPNTKAGLAAATAIDKELLAKYPSMSDEYKSFKRYAWCVGGSYLVMLKKAKVGVPSDLSGLKIGCEAVYFDILKSVGAVPVAIVPPDMYPAIDKGVVDGVIIGFEQLYSLKLDEVLNYYLEYYFAPNIQTLIWNQESWNSLPPDVQKTLDDLALELELTVQANSLAINLQSKDRIIKAGGKVIAAPTPDQTAAWDKVSAIPDAAWLDKMKSMGVTEAPAILQLVKQKTSEAWSNNK